MTGIPERAMLDADAHSYLSNDIDLLTSVVDAGVELYLSAFQEMEIRKGLAGISEERKTEILQKIQRVEDIASPRTTNVDTSGYGEVYGYNYRGSTGEIYEELMQPHPNIGKVHRPDAIGAEAAINREMYFITGDKALQKKLNECGFQEYLLTLDELREIFG